jgi:hypothetical protein
MTRDSGQDAQQVLHNVRTVFRFNEILAIFLMGLPEYQMSVSSPCMIGEVEICKLGTERSRVLGERVEDCTIDNDTEYEQSKASKHQFRHQHWTSNNGRCYVGNHVVE